ncbi:MAG: RelA/SpoT domain-containing protein [Flavobacterium circumlabens]|uniref:GTP pyrophosphokinase n=1 Tax=Flavobacterium circumlabens TaxID=2133765 RepID=UPI0032672A11
MEKIELSNIEAEYNSLIPFLQRFKNSLQDQIEKILEIEEIALGFPIQNRIKKYDSIVEKFETGRFSLKKSVTELQDLVGLRIILLFNRDVKIVNKLINDNLEVVKSYDTSGKLLDNQFGYSSIHLVVKIPETWLNVPTFYGLGTFKAELQIRTLSQHTWAEASNELQYKQKDNIPKPLLRSIGRVSALLETVDLEFDRLLGERDSYKYSLINENQSSKNEDLNVDILETIIESKLPIENKNSNEDISDLILDLKYFDILKTDDLINLIDKHLEEAIVHDKKYARNSNKTNEIFFSRVGLIRVMLDIDNPKKWRQMNENRKK